MSDTTRLLSTISGIAHSEEDLQLEKLSGLAHPSGELFTRFLLSVNMKPTDNKERIVSCSSTRECKKNINVSMRPLSLARN
jgi:hypothetical protein